MAFTWNVTCALGISFSFDTSNWTMIPELSSSDDVRESLTLIRNSMTAFANILGYVAALLAFTYGS